MLHTIIALSLLAGATAFAVDVSTPAIPIAADFFMVEIGVMQLAVSLYMLGYGIAQIPVGLLADHFGRRRTVIVAMSLFAVCGFVAAQSENITLLLAMRFGQGLFGAGGAVIARAIARDITEGAATGRLMGLLTATLGGVMVIAPLIGALLLDQIGWRGPFVASAIFAAVAVIMVLVGIRETMPPRQSLGIGGQFRNGIRAFLDSPQSLLGALYIGLAFCILIAFVTLSSEVFIRHFELGEFGYALIFSLASVGYMTGGLICRRAITNMSAFRLSQMIVTGFFLTALLALVTLPVTSSFPVMLTLIMVAAFICIGAMLSTASTLALAALPQTAGMAAGIMGSFQILLGGAFSVSLSMVPVASLTLLHMAVIGCATLMMAIAVATRRLTIVSGS